MSGADDLEDRRYLERVLGGDKAAFALLVEKYELYVRRMVARHVKPSDTDDVAQQGFVEVYRSLGSFRGDSSFKTWMTRIVLRQCYAYWRQRKARPEIAVSQISAEQANWLEQTIAGTSSASYEEGEDLRRAREVLTLALARLGADDRMIVTLALLEDRPLDEVAAVLGWSSVRVRVRIHRVRGKLKSIIEELTNERESSS
ncbi:MAG: sigma-70 family RNA polymerase sigma factor [Bdellovibrionota bacterium]